MKIIILRNLLRRETRELSKVQSIALRLREETRFDVEL